MNARSNSLLCALCAVFVVAVSLAGGFFPGDLFAPSRAEANLAAGPKILDAARGFIASLEDEQRRKAAFAFEDESRFDWGFVPRERKGLPYKELGADQRKKLDALLASCLSKVGRETVHDVRFLEEVLQKIEGEGRRFSRDPELYFVSVFGEPAGGKRWGWRFEGHHLCLNFTLDGDRVLSATPLFLGANPALVADGPRKGLRVLAGVEDVARELMNALDDAQRKAALGEGRPEEVVGAGTRKYDGPYPSGLAASRLDEKQRALLERLIGEYVKHLEDGIRKSILAEIRDAGLDKVHIAWRGGLRPREGHSYIVHGPTFAIGYANVQDGALHVHSAFRDTTGEFGLAEK